MIDISLINAVSGILAAIGVLVGVIFAVLQLRDLVKTRKTDLVMRLHSIWASREFAEADSEISEARFKDYNDFVKKYGPGSEKPIHISVRIIGAFFEGIGVLLHRKLIDADLVANLFSVKIRWEKMKPLVEGVRKTYNFPQYCEWFEYLYNEMQKREQTLQAIQ